MHMLLVRLYNILCGRASDGLAKAHVYLVVAFGSYFGVENLATLACTSVFVLDCEIYVVVWLLQVAVSPESAGWSSVVCSVLRLCFFVLQISVFS
jgi:hypothetical protein